MKPGSVLRCISWWIMEIKYRIGSHNKVVRSFDANCWFRCAFVLCVSVCAGIECCVIVYDSHSDGQHIHYTLFYSSYLKCRWREWYTKRGNSKNHFDSKSTIRINSTIPNHSPFNAKRITDTHACTRKKMRSKNTKFVGMIWFANNVHFSNVLFCPIIVLTK